MGSQNSNPSPAKWTFTKGELEKIIESPHLCSPEGPLSWQSDRQACSVAQPASGTGQITALPLAGWAVLNSYVGQRSAAQETRSRLENSSHTVTDEGSLHSNGLARGELHLFCNNSWTHGRESAELGRALQGPLGSMTLQPAGFGGAFLQRATQTSLPVIPWLSEVGW